MQTLRIVAFVAASVAATACGGSSPTASTSSSTSSTSSTGSTSLELRGNYVPSSAGAIAAIDFVDDTREQITWTSCSGGASCTRAGTYTLSSDGTELSLTDAVTREVTRLSFDALERSQALTAQDLVQGAGDGGLVSNTGTPLVTSFSAQAPGAAPQTMENDPTEPAANQANTPSSPYDCSGGVCVYDDSSFWGNSEKVEGDLFAE